MRTDCHNAHVKTPGASDGRPLGMGDGRGLPQRQTARVGTAGDRLGWTTIEKRFVNISGAPAQNTRHA